MSGRTRGRTRRAFLRTAGAGLLGFSGCVSDIAGSGSGESGSESGRGEGTANAGPVSILAAGSLQNALENGLAPALDVSIEVEAHGSATVARLVAEGKRNPDIVSIADVALFERPLRPPWHAVFASNAVVIAYNPETEGGQRLADAGTERWYEPLASGEVSLGRTDPDQDPLGYRALFTLELASRYYDDAANLTGKILDREQIYPETALISQFETGGIDAAIAYRNMATERDYAYVDLPDRIDLSNPKHDEEWYSTVSYTLPNGQEIQGGVISYGSTIRRTSAAVLDVFSTHTTGNYLDEYGFLRRRAFPTYEGRVPERVGRATDRRNGTASSRSARVAPDGLEPRDTGQR